MFEVETTSCYANTNLRNHFRQGIWPQRLDGALQVARLRDEFRLRDAKSSNSLMFPCVKDKEFCMSPIFPHCKGESPLKAMTLSP